MLWGSNIVFSFCDSSISQNFFEIFFPVKSSSNLSCGSCTLLNLQTGAFFGAKNGQNVREILYQESYPRINSSYSHIPYPRLTSSSSYIKLFRKVSQWFLLNIELWKQFSTPILDFKILFNIRMIPSITTVFTNFSYFLDISMLCFTLKG